MQSRDLYLQYLSSVVCILEMRILQEGPGTDLDQDLLSVYQKSVVEFPQDLSSAVMILQDHRNPLIHLPLR